MCEILAVQLSQAAVRGGWARRWQVFRGTPAAAPAHCLDVGAPSLENSDSVRGQSVCECGSSTLPRLRRALRASANVRDRVVPKHDVGNGAKPGHAPQEGFAEDAAVIP